MQTLLQEGLVHGDTTHQGFAQLDRREHIRIHKGMTAKIMNKTPGGCVLGKPQMLPKQACPVPFQGGNHTLMAYKVGSEAAHDNTPHSPHLYMPQDSATTLSNESAPTPAQHQYR